MRAVDVLGLVKEILKVVSEIGLHLDDWQYVGLYTDFMRMRQEGEKFRYITSVLAERYGISESSVIRIVKRLSAECQILKP